MPGEIKVLIVEDSPQELLRTESLVHALGYKILATVDNAEDAISAIKKNHPDIMLVDININGPINGIELVEKISDLHIPTIFTTGLESEVMYNRARNTHPAAYLVKPFNKLTFQSAVENAISTLSQTLNTESSKEDSSENAWLTDSFFIKRNNLLQKVRFNDIDYIMSDGNYCEIYANKKYVAKISLHQILKKLPPHQFLRIHQRFIVHAEKIDHIDLQNSELYIKEKPLPIGRKYKEEVLSKVNRLS